MSKHVKHLVAAIIGVLLIVWGISTLGKSSSGPGDLDVITGALEVTEGAEDQFFDIYVDSPILIRQVEMYQNYTDAQGYVRQDFFTTPQKVREKDLNEWYEENFFSLLDFENPSFPHDVKEQVFYGNVRIGEEDIYLSEPYVHKFALSSYIDFSAENKHRRVSGLADGPRVKDLLPLDDYTYATAGGEYWEVGDLRITWFSYSPQDFAAIYTAAGTLEGDVIGPKNSLVFFYDKAMTEAEIAELYSTRNYTAGIIIVGAGVVTLLLAAFCFIRARKAGESLATPTEQRRIYTDGTPLEDVLGEDAKNFEATTLGEAWREIHGDELDTDNKNGGYDEKV